ncbi:MAG: hypothetical protein PHD66_08010 [Eubacteriales bacterium]|nr:hypothetical protein [Eubacteriales bacterium]
MSITKYDRTKTDKKKTGKMRIDRTITDKTKFLISLTENKETKMITITNLTFFKMRVENLPTA